MITTYEGSGERDFEWELVLQTSSSWRTTLKSVESPHADPFILNRVPSSQYGAPPTQHNSKSNSWMLFECLLYKCVCAFVYPRACTWKRVCVCKSKGMHASLIIKTTRLNFCELAQRRPISRGGGNSSKCPSYRLIWITFGAIASVILEGPGAGGFPRPISLKARRGWGLTNGILQVVYLGP